MHNEHIRAIKQLLAVQIDGRHRVDAVENKHGFCAVGRQSVEVEITLIDPIRQIDPPFADWIVRRQRIADQSRPLQIQFHIAGNGCGKAMFFICNRMRERQRPSVIERHILHRVVILLFVHYLDDFSFLLCLRASARCFLHLA